MKQIVFQEKSRQVSFFQSVPRSAATWAPDLFQTSRAPAPHDGRIIRERNRRPGWSIGSTERLRFPSASRFVCLPGPWWSFVDNSFFLLIQMSLPPPTGATIEPRPRPGPPPRCRPHVLFARLPVRSTRQWSPEGSGPRSRPGRGGLERRKKMPSSAPAGVRDPGPGRPGIRLPGGSTRLPPVSAWGRDRPLPAPGSKPDRQWHFGKRGPIHIDADPYDDEVDLPGIGIHLRQHAAALSAGE